MIVHIGCDEAVEQSKILMILNLNGEKAYAHEEWLKHMRREGCVRQLPGGTPKCAVVVADGRRKGARAQAILSVVNTATIVKREAGYTWLENTDG